MGGRAERESEFSAGVAEDLRGSVAVVSGEALYFSMRHFHEKLQSEHGTEFSYTWVQQALRGAGLVKRRSRRRPHWRRRERRPLPGMLLHMDGSKNRWLNDDRWYVSVIKIRSTRKQGSVANRRAEARSNLAGFEWTESQIRQSVRR
jgi:hypothetical protein